MPTASALSAPAATSHTSSARRDRGERQRDPRRWRLRAAPHGRHRPLLVHGGCLREDRGHVAVLADAEQQHVEAGERVPGPRRGGQLVGVARGRGLRVVAVRSVRGAASGAPGPGRAARRRAVPRGPGSRCDPGRPRAGTARRPTTGPASTSRPRRGRGPARACGARSCPARRRSARPSPPARGLRVDDPRHEPLGGGDRQCVGVAVHLDLGRHGANLTTPACRPAAGPATGERADRGRSSRSWTPVAAPSAAA